MKDQQTEEYIKAWGAKEVPIALVRSGRIQPGHYRCFPVFGWVKQRQADWPVVGVHLAILPLNAEKTIGALSMDLPLTPKTERNVCAFLQDLCWDGRVWPYKDHGWPEGTEEEQDLLKLLRTVKLGATMTFPTDPEKGTRIVRIPVLHGKKKFHVAPFGTEVPVPRFMDELRDLAANPHPFVSDWT